MVKYNLCLYIIRVDGEDEWWGGGVVLVLHYRHADWEEVFKMVGLHLLERVVDGKQKVSVSRQHCFCKTDIRAKGEPRIVTSSFDLCLDLLTAANQPSAN